MIALSTAQQHELENMLTRRPELKCCENELMQLNEVLVRTFDGNGKLLICGNGGSCADAMHIAGELCKSFEAQRPVPKEMADALKDLPFGDQLALHLEVGLPAIPLGFSNSLKTAVENDSQLRDIAFAQECYALIKPGDTLIAISTSGNADNCLMAMSVAKACGATTVSLAGSPGGKMAASADIAIKAPGDTVKEIQENHVALYHTTCLLVETHYFPNKKTEPFSAISET
jgi:D-sedoheptulose 7-phosphate isomerase